MSIYFPTKDDCTHKSIFPGVNIMTCCVEKMMLSVVDLQPHSIVAEHSHPHEQVGMLLEGKALFTIGGEEKLLKKGDMWRIPGNIKHKVVVLDEPTKALDIFCPIREDYR